ncbi:glycosyltransferase [Zooshikella harenae]|uniref:Uncharacterized protein n=1 Tax=Zooshikella harenae TaxID=2827238 RepID=A0ABS5Z785_9GAMM|nr:glycosyltransferase [Zooshikella harenae]MBU2709623.1 hypothetical protein [Zooshikella harenae]
MDIKIEDHNLIDFSKIQWLQRYGLPKGLPPNTYIDWKTVNGSVEEERRQKRKGNGKLVGDTSDFKVWHIANPSVIFSTEATNAFLRALKNKKLDASDWAHMITAQIRGENTQTFSQYFSDQLLYSAQLAYRSTHVNYEQGELTQRDVSTIERFLNGDKAIEAFIPHLPSRTNVPALTSKNHLLITDKQTGVYIWHFANGPKQGVRGGFTSKNDALSWYKEWVINKGIRQSAHNKGEVYHYYDANFDKSFVFSVSDFMHPNEPFPGANNGWIKQKLTETVQKLKLHTLRNGKKYGREMSDQFFKAARADIDSQFKQRNEQFAEDLRYWFDFVSSFTGIIGVGTSGKLAKVLDFTVILGGVGVGGVTIANADNPSEKLEGIGAIIEATADTLEATSVGDRLSRKTTAIGNLFKGTSSTVRQRISMNKNLSQPIPIVLPSKVSENLQSELNQIWDTPQVETTYNAKKLNVTKENNQLETILYQGKAYGRFPNGYWFDFKFDMPKTKQQVHPETTVNNHNSRNDDTSLSIEASSLLRSYHEVKLNTDNLNQPEANGIISYETKKLIQVNNKLYEVKASPEGSEWAWEIIVANGGQGLSLPVKYVNHKWQLFYSAQRIKDIFVAQTIDQKVASHFNLNDGNQVNWNRTNDLLENSPVLAGETKNLTIDTNSIFEGYPSQLRNKPIPRNLHRIWFGKPLSSEQAELLLNDSNHMRQALANDIKVILYTNNKNRSIAKIKQVAEEKGYSNDIVRNIRVIDLSEFFTELKTHIGNNAATRLESAIQREINGPYRSYATAADIMRFCALYRYGGIYADFDVTPKDQGDYTKLFSQSGNSEGLPGVFFGERLSQGLILDVHLIGAQRGHPFIESYLTQITRKFSIEFIISSLNKMKSNAKKVAEGQPSEVEELTTSEKRAVEAFNAVFDGKRSSSEGILREKILQSQSISVKNNDPYATLLQQIRGFVFDTANNATSLPSPLSNTQERDNRIISHLANLNSVRLIENIIKEQFLDKFEKTKNELKTDDQLRKKLAEIYSKAGINFDESLEGKLEFNWSKQRGGRRASTGAITN